MKIVIVSIFRKNFGGGEGRVAHEMADVFAERHDVTLVCPGEQTGLHVHKNGLKEFTIKSVNRDHLSVPLLSPATLRTLYNYLESFSPDVIHAHDPALLGVVLQVWAKTHRVPFVYTTHVLPTRATEFGTMDVLRLNLDFVAKPLIRRFLLNFYNNCDAVIALNQPAFNEVRAFGYQGKLSILPNGRRLSRYEARVLPTLDCTHRNLISIGQLTSRKNQSYLLEVMRHLPSSYKLRIAGSPLTPAYGALLMEQAREYGLNNVTFLGEVAHEKVAELLAESHLFLSASTMEVQSLVVIEALASGTPVAGLSNETIDELVDSRVGVPLPKSTTPETFASAVEHIFAQPASTYLASCEAARQRVQHLDWSKVMERTTTLYAQLIDEPVTRPSSNPAQAKLAAQILRFIPDEQWKETVLDLAASLPATMRHSRPVSLETRLISGMTNTGSSLLYAALKADQVIRTRPTGHVV